MPFGTAEQNDQHRHVQLYWLYSRRPAATHRPRALVVAARLAIPFTERWKMHCRYRRGCPARTRSSKPPLQDESATATPKRRRRPRPRSHEEESELDPSGRRRQDRVAAKFPRAVNHRCATRRCSTHATTHSLPSSRTTTFHHRKRKSDAEEATEASRNSRGTRGETTAGASPPHFRNRTRSSSRSRV